MYSVETATAQNKTYFAFNKALDSEKFLICEMTCRDTDTINIKKLCNTHYNEKTRIKIVTVVNQYIIQHLYDL